MFLRIILPILVVCAPLLAPAKLTAHDNHGGYEISINGEKVAHSSVPELSANGILVPSYTGWKIYQPNQKLNFSIDLNEYVIPKEKTKYLVWNFGDESQPKYGNPVSHTYTKAGSYILRLAYYEPEVINTPMSVNETLIHVGPADFSPPRGQISVNGTIYDTPAENMTVDLEKELEFKLVPAPGTELGEFDVFWDFGGGNTVTGNPVKYTFKRGPDGNQLDLVQAVVRYSTPQGYTNFQWVGLKNQPDPEVIEFTETTDKIVVSPYLIIGVLAVVLITVLTLLRYLEKRQ